MREIKNFLEKILYSFSQTDGKICQFFSLSKYCSRQIQHFLRKYFSNLFRLDLEIENRKIKGGYYVRQLNILSDRSLESRLCDNNESLIRFTKRSLKCHKPINFWVKSCKLDELDYMTLTAGTTKYIYWTTLLFDSWHDVTRFAHLEIKDKL